VATVLVILLRINCPCCQISWGGRISPWLYA